VCVCVCVCVCACSGCTLCYIGVYQCGLWSIVQVCLCGDWRFVLTGCGRGVCGGGSCWRFKVLGSCVFVIKSLHMLWVFSVVVRLDSGNGCVV